MRRCAAKSNTPNPEIGREGAGKLTGEIAAVPRQKQRKAQPCAKIVSPRGFGTARARLAFSSGTPVPDTHCPKTHSLQGGASDFLPAVRSLAPDPHVHGRTLLPSQWPHFFLLLPRSPAPTLDDGPHSALFLQDSGCSAPGDRQPDRRQRSFNWQSTAFVMRGLWVRFPPLAFGVRCAI